MTIETRTFRFPSTGLKVLAESPYHGLNPYAKKNEAELFLGENNNISLKKGQQKKYRIFCNQTTWFDILLIAKLKTFELLNSKSNAVTKISMLSSNRRLNNFQMVTYIG